MSECPIPPRYVGRFAPSPTGDLHFGSLVAAVASYLESRAHEGQWLVRVEDLDPPREVVGSAERILADLDRLALSPDGPVLLQSSRRQAHEAARDALLRAGLAYWCGCSRSDLPPGGIYPGTCREGLSRGKEPRAVRLRVPEQPIRFFDRIQGPQSDELPGSCGDFVIWRADGVPAYQLAVVVDDAFQNVTDIVRGADLLDSTARQIHVQRCLGLPTPGYAHVPVALKADGSKLSKRLSSDPVRLRDGTEAVRDALRFLGHEPPGGGLADVWAWAVENWRLTRVPRRSGLPSPIPVPA